jgi:TPR repeat protein
MKVPSPKIEFVAAVAAMRRGDYRAAAEIGYREASCRRSRPFSGIGSKYASDELVASLRWLQSAADGGLAEAQQLLGVAFGQGEVVFGDREASRRYHKMAALQGLAQAQCSFGRILCSGTARDIRAGLSWIRKGADQHDARSQLELGLQYLWGRGVAQSDKNAVVWIKRAADQGLARAQYELAKMYDGGRAASQDTYDEVRLLRMAADQGYPDAQFDLGMRYKEGRGVGRNDEEAFAWFLSSGERGDIDGQRAVAVAYIAGDGVEVDHSRATDWLIKLHFDGDDDARYLLNLVSDPQLQQKYEAATAQNEVAVEEDEKVREKISAIRSRRVSTMRWPELD